jgi:hypothetical protein
MTPIIYDLFPGWSYGEIASLFDYAFTAINLFGFVLVLGLAGPSPAAASPSAE